MNSYRNKLIKSIADKIKCKFLNEGSGHDWWHIYRVWQNGIKIAESENADMFIVQLGCLLHDIADWKFYDGDQDIGPKKAEEILKEFAVEQSIIERIKKIIKKVSFKGAEVMHEKMNSIEGKIVQDADRLDAMGAIGIARTFAYGGYKNRLIYDPNIKPVMHENQNDYIKNNSPSINHFYEKLLLLKDLMNTKTGKKMAQQRHIFMKNYLQQFYQEWNSNIVEISQ
ncbi:HD domain-containing protein [Candidatus Dependentiae bacterium]|nr:HD domain-containing protein [Candidatus Dependentiae bacterium]